jgi:hypothetical protein
MSKKVHGQVSAGSTPVYEVIDSDNDFYIEIREIDNPANVYKFPKQAAHILAKVLLDVK